MGFPSCVAVASVVASADSVACVDHAVAHAQDPPVGSILVTDVPESGPAIHDVVPVDLTIPAVAVDAMGLPGYVCAMLRKPAGSPSVPPCAPKRKYDGMHLLPKTAITPGAVAREDIPMLRRKKVKGSPVSALLLRGLLAAAMSPEPSRKACNAKTNSSMPACVSTRPSRVYESRTILRTEFESLQQLSGKHFTYDACANNDGSNALCPRFSCPKQLCWSPCLDASTSRSDRRIPAALLALQSCRAYSNFWWIPPS